MKISSIDTYSVVPKSWQIFAVKIQDENEDTLIDQSIVETSEISKIILRFRKYQSVIMKEFATWKYLILSEIAFVTKLNGAKTLKFHTIPCCYYGWKWV